MYDRSIVLYIDSRGRLPFSLLVLFVVLILPHGYNAVRGHRTGSNNSGGEDYLRRKTSKKQKIVHTITATNGIPQTKIKW